MLPDWVDHIIEGYSHTGSDVWNKKINIVIVIHMLPDWVDHIIEGYSHTGSDVWNKKVTLW